MGQAPRTCACNTRQRLPDTQAMLHAGSHASIPAGGPAGRPPCCAALRCTALRCAAPCCAVLCCAALCCAHVLGYMSTMWSAYTVAGTITVAASTARLPMYHSMTPRWKQAATARTKRTWSAQVYLRANKGPRGGVGVVRWEVKGWRRCAGISLYSRQRRKLPGPGPLDFRTPRQGRGWLL